MGHLQLVKLLSTVADYWLPLLGGLITCFSLAATWAVTVTNRWLSEHLAREQQRFDRLESVRKQREIERHNETVKILSTAFASGEPLTLDDLLSSAERDWSLRSSALPSEPPAPPESTPPPSVDREVTTRKSVPVFPLPPPLPFRPNRK